MAGWSSVIRLADSGHALRFLKPGAIQDGADCSPTFVPARARGSVWDEDEHPEIPGSGSIEEALGWSEVVFARLPPGSGGKDPFTSGCVGVPAWFEFLIRSRLSGKLLVVLCRAPDRLMEGLLSRFFAEAGDASCPDIVFQVSFEAEAEAVGPVVGPVPGALIAGVGSPQAKQIVRKIYPDPALRLIFTDHRTAEMVQLAGNAMAASHAALFETLAPVLRSLDMETRVVVETLERNLFSSRFGLSGGPGFDSGGHRESLELLLAATSQSENSSAFLRSLADSCARRLPRLIERLKTELGSFESRRIACVGVADWAGLSRVEASDGWKFCGTLVEQRAKVFLLESDSDSDLAMPQGVQRCRSSNIQELVRDSDALVVFASHQPLRSLDLALLKGWMKRPLVVDLALFFDPAEMKALGFEYHSVP